MNEQEQKILVKAVSEAWDSGFAAAIGVLKNSIGAVRRKCLADPRATPQQKAALEWALTNTINMINVLEKETSGAGVLQTEYTKARTASTNTDATETGEKKCER